MRYGRIPLWSRSPWKWLFTIRVGLLLLGLLAVGSIFGTLIDPLERAQQLVYHSWWYRLLLLLLAINISCATARTVVEKVLPLRRARFQRSPAFYTATGPSMKMNYHGEVGSVAGALRRQGFKVATDQGYGYANKGLFSSWGAPISHLGIVIVLLGGFASGWVATEGTVKLVEGEQTDEIMLRADPPQSIPLNFIVRCDDFETGFFPKTRIPSKYISTVTILNAGHRIITAPVEVNRSLRVGGWNLHQTSYEELHTQVRYRVMLSHPDLPTTSTIEISPGQRRSVPFLGETEIALGQGIPLRWTIMRRGLPTGKGVLTGSGESLWVRAEQFEPDFVMGADRTVSSRSHNMNNPALKIAVYEGERQLTAQWLFAREDMKAIMRSHAGPYAFELVDITGPHSALKFQIAARTSEEGEPVGDFSLSLGEEVLMDPSSTHLGRSPDFQATQAGGMPTEHETGSGDWDVRLLERVPAYATVLTLTRNPVIPVIYVGCALIVIGLIVAFSIRRRQVWFWLNTEKNCLQIAAIYRLPRTTLDPATRTAIASLEDLHPAPSAANDDYQDCITNKAMNR